MTGSVNLTGNWRGIFNYPDNVLPPTEFTAELRDSDGRLAGETSELDSNPDAPGKTLFALLSGQRSGSNVDFIKTYDAVDYDAILYAGTLSDDANEISGRWIMPGEWSGTFIMIRRSGKAEATERTVHETVEI